MKTQSFKNPIRDEVLLKPKMVSELSSSVNISEFKGSSKKSKKVKVCKYCGHIISLLLIVIMVCGCAMGGRIKGGATKYTSSGGAKIEMVQGEDAKLGSGFQTKLEKSFEMIIPAGSKVVMEPPITSTEVVSKSTHTNAPFFLLSSNMPVRIMTVETLDVNHGAAQKNNLGEVIAKLNSLKWVSWIGVALFLFGLASLFYPPLRALIGSVSTSLAFAGGGLLLIVLPIVIVGNEILILCIIGSAVGLYFFAHRYGSKSGEIKTLRGFIDKNKDGIDDRKQ